MKNALIVAAGLGTRLRPLTDTMPKALVPVAGRPMLEHQIIRLREAGFTHIVVNVHHFGEQIIQWVEANRARLMVDLFISDERQQLLDTGGAVRHALALFDDTPILVHNVDIFSNADLRAFSLAHESSHADASLLVSRRDSTRHLLFTPSMRLLGWENVQTGQEKQGLSRDHFPAAWATPLPLAYAGVCMLSPTLRASLLAQPEVFSIIDWFLAQTSHHAIYGVEAQAGFRLVDAGKPESLPKAAALVEEL